MVLGVRSQVRQRGLFLHPMGSENQPIRILRAEQALDLTCKMTREPLLMPLLGLAKDLDHESNGWDSNQGKTCFGIWQGFS